MQYTSEVIDGKLLIHISGDLLGLSEEQELFEFAKTQVEQSINKCAIDISEVGYMNSTGLSLLIRLLTRFRNDGGELVLINPSEQVKKLLVITKLSAIFSVFDSKNEALAAL